MTGPSRRKKTAGGATATAAGSERLQKVLAAGGIGSRRECEQLITEGRVQVDRDVVDQLGAKVDPIRQEIRIDGVALPKPKRVYFALNKPSGVVCTNSDPNGRLRAVDMIDCPERLFTIGRLDRSSEGLIIVTNDGSLTNRLTHPRYGVEKEYAVRVKGVPTHEALSQLRKGVRLAEGTASVKSLRVKRRHKAFTDLEIVLNEGRNREIRRILARIGHKVLKLRRISMGTLRLGEMPVGAYRKLTPLEIRKLEQCAEQSKTADGDAAPRKKKRTYGSRKKSFAKRTAPKSAVPKGTVPKKRAARTKSDDRSPMTSERQGAVLPYDDVEEKPIWPAKKSSKPKAKTGGRTKSKPASKMAKPKARRKGRR